MRVRNQKKKHPAGSPSRLAQAEKMRKYHAERRRALDDLHNF
jgi:hypothetical protein